MKTEMMKRNQQGFTLIELMIVVAIIGILAAIALPAYQTYTAKARFTEVVQATSPYKLGVEMCYAETGDLADCGTAGTKGIPAATTSGAGFVASVAVGANGVVTATAVSTDGLSGETFRLTPAAAAGGSGVQLEWTRSGTCGANGLCSVD